MSCGCEYFSKKSIWVGQASFQYSETYTVSIPYWSILGELWVRVLLQEEYLGGTGLVPVLRDLHCKYTILIYTGWAVGASTSPRRGSGWDRASFQYSETYTVSTPYWSILGELWVRVLLQEEDLGGTGLVPVLRDLHCKYTILTYTGWAVGAPYWSILGELWVRELLQEEDLGGTGIVPVLRDLHCKYTILIYTGWAVGASTSPRRGSGWDRHRSSTQRPTL